MEFTKFTIRKEKPGEGNKYYIRTAQGGWSPSIYGKPTDSECNVLSNCVGYACGRFAEISNEIDGAEGIEYQELGKHNAKALMTYAKKLGLETGSTPKPGAIMCYGQSDNGYGSQGHVLIVEDVIDDKHIDISDSAYGGSAWRYAHCTLNKNGTWKIAYVGGNSWSPEGLQGFVYNPNVEEVIYYNIIKKECSDGSYFISKNKAVEGESVGITYYPDKGYQLDYVEINGKKLYDDYMFIMPGEDVVVNVVYKSKWNAFIETVAKMAQVVVKFIGGLFNGR